MILEVFPHQNSAQLKMIFHPYSFIFGAPLILFHILFFLINMTVFSYLCKMYLLNVVATHCWLETHNEHKLKKKTSYHPFPWIESQIGNGYRKNVILTSIFSLLKTFIVRCLNLVGGHLKWPRVKRLGIQPSQSWIGFQNPSQSYDILISHVIVSICACTERKNKLHGKI